MRLAVFLLGAAIALVVSGYVLHRRTKTLSFADVRHVGVLLDMLLLRMRYGVQRQDRNSIEYLHYLMKWKQWKLFSWVKWADTLVVEFDGNRVSVCGPYFHVAKLLRTLRRYELR